MTNSRRQCYFCGAQPTSKEHIPPNILFRGRPSPGVTVPACDLHNNKKSQSDVAVVNAFLMALERVRENWLVDEEVSNVIDVVKPNFNQTRHDVTVAQIMDQFDQELPHIASLIDIKLWVCQITAGLVYKRLGRFEPSINWKQARLYSPDWFPHKDPTPMPQNEFFAQAYTARQFRAEAGRLPWRQGWLQKAYPEKLYRYNVLYKHDLSVVIFQHTFYDTFTWYVFFDIPSHIEAELI